MLTADPIDRPTTERLAKARGDHEDFVTESGRRTLRMLDGSVLDMLASRRSITGDQYAAGAEFYRDWYLAGLAASGVIDPAKEVVDGGQIAGQSEVQMHHLGKWQKAVAAIGRVHSNAIVCIVLNEERLEDFGKRVFGYAKAKNAALSALTSLRLALTELDHHYHGQRHTKTRVSHLNDYRPTELPEGD